MRRNWFECIVKTEDEYPVRVAYADGATCRLGRASPLGLVVDECANPEKPGEETRVQH